MHNESVRVVRCPTYSCWFEIPALATRSRERPTHGGRVNNTRGSRKHTAARPPQLAPCRGSRVVPDARGGSSGKRQARDTASETRPHAITSTERTAPSLGAASIYARHSRNHVGLSSGRRTRRVYVPGAAHARKHVAELAARSGRAIPQGRRERPRAIGEAPTVSRAGILVLRARNA